MDKPEPLEEGTPAEDLADVVLVAFIEKPKQANEAAWFEAPVFRAFLPQEPCHWDARSGCPLPGWTRTNWNAASKLAIQIGEQRRQVWLVAISRSVHPNERRFVGENLGGVWFEVRTKEEVRNSPVANESLAFAAEQLNFQQAPAAAGNAATMAPVLLALLLGGKFVYDQYKARKRAAT